MAMSKENGLICTYLIINKLAERERKNRSSDLEFAKTAIRGLTD